MPASPSAQGSSGIRAALVDEVIAIRDKMVGPDGSDPALSRPISLDDDAIEMCAAVYALPGQFRERGRSGTPLMWPWPWDRFQGGLSRREELLLRRCCWPRRNEWITKGADVSSGICSRCPLWAVIAVQLR